MTGPDARSAIVREAQRIGELVAGTKWYGFGSFFKETAFADIDLLIVCPSDADVMAVRSEIEAICADWPLHVLLMSEAESQQTDFVRSQCATRLFPAT